ncbi:MAG: 3-phosphoshikimate 1-carboxyvinyltransferase [Candidatus Helarchaeota archaeon]
MDIKVFKTDRISGTILAPPSKSYTHRAIIMSSLANGTSTIRYPLLSNDTLSSISACETLGAEIKNQNGKYLEINGCFPFNPINNSIDVGNSGTTMRIMTAICGFFPGKITLTGDQSIKKRPMGPLISSLSKLGVQIKSLHKNDCPPIIIEGPSLIGGKTNILGNISSQFITGLLIACPLAKKNTELKITTELKSKPYIMITLKCLKEYLIDIKYDPNLRDFLLTGNQTYNPVKFDIPGDFSSASFSLALAAITGSKITISNLNIESPQGDKQIISILEKMGCNIKIDKKQNSVSIESNGELKGIELDMSDIPDLFPVMCILGTFAHGKTRLFGAKHLRYKESDRIKALASELANLNVRIKENDDGVEIIGPNIIRPNKVHVYDDHRIAMALTILGVKTDQMVIPNVDVSIISYPNFLNDLKRLGIQFEVIE